MKNIVSDVYVSIFASDTHNEETNKKSLDIRREILSELNLPFYDDKFYTPRGADDFYLFYECYTFPKTEYDKIKNIVKAYHEKHGFKGNVQFDIDCLYDFEETDTIELDTKVRISDPCYGMDVWCAGTLENVLPGAYRCFYQMTDEDRVAAIKVVHKDYDPEKYMPSEHRDITVGVDSGSCGIYDLSYFTKNCTDEDWYDSTWDISKAETFDGKALISRSGYGDGSYDCFVARNDNGQIIAVEIAYIQFGEEEDDENEYS